MVGSFQLVSLDLIDDEITLCETHANDVGYEGISGNGTPRSTTKRDVEDASDDHVGVG
jgi:hypothetical protein